MNEAILRAIDMLQDYKGVLAAQTFADNDEGDYWQRINENKRTSVHAAIVGLRAILAAQAPAQPVQVPDGVCFWRKLDGYRFGLECGGGWSREDTRDGIPTYCCNCGEETELLSPFHDGVTWQKAPTFEEGRAAWEKKCGAAPSEPAAPTRYADGQINIDNTLFNEILISEPVNEEGEPTKYIITEQQLQRIAQLEFDAPSPVLADVPTLDPACCGDANDCPIDYSDCPHKGMPPAPKCNVCGVKVLECDKNGCCGMPTCLDELERLNNKL